MTFQEKLDSCIEANNSLVCIGLDSDIAKIPHHLRTLEYPQFTFNKALIENTYDLVCCYKPNSAFYEARGERGVLELKMTCDYINETFPHIPVILDAKRADIGSTNEGYMQYVYDYLHVDAVTLQPYLGSEALTPFLQRKEKGSIILCRTSNPGAGEFQDLEVNGHPLYTIVAKHVSEKWNTNKNCLLVVGATYPNELALVRSLVGDMTILVPGIGTQGGDIEKTLLSGLNDKKRGLIINASRSVIFSASDKNFTQKVRSETKAMRETINQYRK